jgi:hypothetical protein
MACCVALGAAVIGLGGCSNGRRVPGWSLFEQYVMNFQLPPREEGDTLPFPEPLPEKVYESAMATARTDRPRFEEMVCSYLLKYCIYYRRYCNQGYSFAGPHEKPQIDPNSKRNDKFFMVNAFLAFSGRKYEDEDGVPDILVVDYCHAELKGSKVIAEQLMEFAAVQEGIPGRVLGESGGHGEFGDRP